MPKTSIWHHIKDLKITDAQKRKIYSERGGSRERKEEMWRSAEKEVDRLFSKEKNDRDLIVSVGSLYWAEGREARKFWGGVTMIPNENITINHNNLHNKTKT